LFHIFIITFFSFLVLSGCGYKSDPYWMDNVASATSNVKGERDEKI